MAYDSKFMTILDNSLPDSLSGKLLEFVRHRHSRCLSHLIEFSFEQRDTFGLKNFQTHRRSLFESIRILENSPCSHAETFKSLIQVLNFRNHFKNLRYDRIATVWTGVQSGCIRNPIRISKYKERSSD